ncbi:MAG: phosphotransferase [Armatimonadetes bacterium]|nr:phosphotransferase [Armatimonadota bacterium]
MLELTLATKFVPGTNAKARLAGASWTFLLPRLDLERIVCFGLPTPAALGTLTRLTQSVTVVCEDAWQARVALREQSAERNSVQVLIAAEGEPLPLPDTSVDLAVIVAHGAARRLQNDAHLRREIGRLCKPSGLIYLEFARMATTWPGPAAEELGQAQLFWLTPLAGEMQTAVPLDDARTMNYFLRHGLFAVSSRWAPLQRLEWIFAQQDPLNALARRFGTLISRSREPSDALPRYLSSVAEAAGIDLDAYRWGLSAPGPYNSRKVLFYLFDEKTGVPKYVIKITRDPALNYRLENEYRALTWLHEKRLGGQGQLPRTVFFGYHHGLAILGETFIEGVPFRQRMSAQPNAPVASSVVEWLTELAEATVTLASPPQVAGALDKLFNQFTQIYRLGPAHVDYLARQIAAVGRSREPLPLVFQHGDPGTWNMMVTTTGQVAFLDWEAAEPQGMPLWDLLYFLRSHATTVSRLTGIRDSLKSFKRQFLMESPMSQQLIEATQRYCVRTGLAPELVEPLFYTCWMHRALKEATRLPAAHLDRGHYVNLLRLCIEQRGAPPLRQLTSLRMRPPGAVAA